jgi:hypothetical protein
MDAKFIKAVNSGDVAFIEEHVYDVSRQTLQRALARIKNIIKNEFEDDEDGAEDYKEIESLIQSALS